MLSKLHDVGFANESNPRGSLISDGTFLYGMTSDASTYSYGTIFKIKPDGTGYSKLLDFGGVANGKSPQGSLNYDGVFLYGMTKEGGTSNKGVIFKIKPDGTGYSKLLDFTGTANGWGPIGSLVSDGTFLYGMSTWGGTNNMGTIFKIKPDGTGYSKLLDFAGIANGKYPYGSLISDGVFLYGMTNSGGTNDFGIIFKIKSDGTGFANLLNFDGTNGINPFGSLISNGVFLYGMANEIIFKIKPDGTGYSNLLYFTGTNGRVPMGSLIFVGTFMYGMTAYGGTNDDGVVFKYASGTGIAENNTETDFNIYPNPTNGKMEVRSEALKVRSIEIYNILGEIIYSIINNRQQEKYDIDISSSPKGIYFFKIYDKEKIYIEKIVKQ